MVVSLKYLAGAFLLTLLCVVAVSFLGPLALVFNLFAACPVAFVAWRVGRWPALAVVLLVVLVLWSSTGAGNAVAYLLQFGIGALSLGLLLRRDYPWDRSVALALLVTLFLAVIVFFGYAARQGSDGISLANQIVKVEIDRGLALLQKEDLSAAQRDQMQQLGTQVAAILQQAWPALTVVFVGITLLTAVFVLSALGRGLLLVPGPMFIAWKSPELLVWPLIVAGFAFFYSHGLAETIALNLLIVLLPVYFLHGLAVVAFYFQAKGISPLFRSLGYTLALLLNPLPLLVTLLGLFDLWADFRKPRVKHT